MIEGASAERDSKGDSKRGEGFPAHPAFVDGERLRLEIAESGVARFYIDREVGPRHLLSGVDILEVARELSVYPSVIDEPGEDISDERLMDYATTLVAGFFTLGGEIVR